MVLFLFVWTNGGKRVVLKPPKGGRQPLGPERMGTPSSTAILTILINYVYVVFLLGGGKNCGKG